MRGAPKVLAGNGIKVLIPVSSSRSAKTFARCLLPFPSVEFKDVERSRDRFSVPS